MNPISTALLNEIARALQTVGPYGSIEIYVQNSVVTQITLRNIRKTNVELVKSNKPANGQKHRVISRKRT